MLPVYKDPIRRIPLDEVVFRQETRKGKDKNHTVPICSELRLRLKDYNPSINLYHFSLFASQRMQAWQAFERGCLSWI
jgi:hypothetical protein